MLLFGQLTRCRAGREVFFELNVFELMTNLLETVKDDKVVMIHSSNLYKLLFYPFLAAGRYCVGDLEDSVQQQAGAEACERGLDHPCAHHGCARVQQQGVFPHYRCLRGVSRGEKDPSSHIGTGLH